MKLKNSLGLLAILACGIVKQADAAEATDQMDQCLKQAQTAYAVVHARDAGKQKADVVSYIETNEPPKYQPIYKRIINKAYGEPYLTKLTAYNGELTYCIAHQPKKSKQKVVAK